MATRLIELEDGILIEVEAPPGQASQISGGAAEKVLDATVAKITPTLIKVCKPLVEAWAVLSQEMDVEGADVELGFSFDIEGNLYLAKATTGANITVKLALRPLRGSS